MALRCGDGPSSDGSASLQGLAGRNLVRRGRRGGMPLVLSTSQVFLFSQVCIFAIIALSLTILTGWAGQVSLGQLGLVAVGTLMAAHLGSSVPTSYLSSLAGS